MNFSSIIRVQLLIASIIFAMISTFVGVFGGLSFLIGSAVVLVNLLAFKFFGYMIIRKKLFALATVLIVSKYALLGFTVYQIIKIPWVQPLLFGLGVGTLVLSIVAVSLFQQPQRGADVI